MRKLFSVAAFGVLVGTTGTAFAQGDEGLFGMDGLGICLYSVEADPVSATLIGCDLTPDYFSEIEYGDGFIYGSDTGTNEFLHVIDPATGVVMDTITMAFPAEGNVITAMEFLDGTLYAGLTTEGGGFDTYLVTIDLGTGNVALVGGATGVGGPMGGLAYQDGTMYGISAGGSGGRLYTMDLGTGAANFVANITVDGGTVGLTALEFGTDGVMYAMPNEADLLAGHLLSVDPATGDAIDLGDTGYTSMNGLTAMPGGGGGLNTVINGECPGTLEIVVTGATPGGRVAIVYGTRPGPYVHNGGICTGITLDVSPPFLPGSPAVRTANALGEVSLVGNAPPALCGRGLVQAVDLDTCAVSNLATF